MRSLVKNLDRTDPIEEAYFLEVSSPGAERPLKKGSDLKKAVGKHIAVSTYEPVDGQKSFEGTLVSFDGQTVVIEVTVKTRKKVYQIPYTKVANARLAILF